MWISAAARPDDGDELALVDAEIDAVERPDFLAAEGVVFSNVFEENESHGGGRVEG